MKIALLVSGHLGFESLKYLKDKYLIVAVFTDGKSQDIINLCTEIDIPLFIGNPRIKNVELFIKEIEVDVLLSINYIYIIKDDLISWAKKAAINLHGSLLPKYRGRTPHVWAIINNEKETGISAHMITSICDQGAIIKQLRIPIHDDDTGATILERFVNLYPSFADEVLSLINEDNFELDSQVESQATYFGKRTPYDGQINWDWQKERIKNWVRAQAFPYPGAFTYLNKEKVIIDSVEFDDLGYDNEMDNGLILSINPLRVKTPNGAIRITSLRFDSKKVSKNMKFAYDKN